MRAAFLLPFAALTFAALPVAAQDEPARVVRHLGFAGNRALDHYTLEASIATTRSSGFATFFLVRWLGLGEKRYFDETEFRRDVVRLVLLYRQSGYMNAVVDTVVRRTPRDVFITFRIHEGDPVRVARLEVRGVAGLVDTARLRRELPLQVGDPFNRFLMQASADTIAFRLRNLGYPYAEVLRSFDSEAGALRAEVELEAVPGPRMRVGEVVIRGLENLDTSTVRRLLSVHAGERYRQDALYRSQRDLYGLGVFRSANVLLVDSLLPEQIADDSTVRVLVQVQEGPRHATRMGGGYGSAECLRVQTGWVARNFRGGARTLDLSARLSKIGGGSPRQTTGLSLCRPFFIDSLWSPDTLNYTLSATLRQPAFLSRAHTASAAVFAERRSEPNVYTRQAVGSNFEVTFNARRAVPVTLGYGYSVGQTTASAGIYCSVFQVCDRDDQNFLANARSFGAVTVTGLRDRVNNPLDATQGSLITASVMHASRLVGSATTYEFNRGEIEFAHYYPIGRRTVFAWRARAGTILPQRITLSGQSARFVPPDQRFYGGGPNSVRGYGRNELGPRVYVTDSVNVAPGTGDTTFGTLHPAPIGGNSLVLLNVELRAPSPVWSQRVRWALFVDVGRVWQRQAELFTLDSLRITPGVGIRVTTPLGPVRLDVAYNGYGAEPGAVYLRDETTDDLTLVGSLAAAPPPRGLRRRLVMQLAVGQAF